MIKRISTWKLKDEHREPELRRMKSSLESLGKRIGGITSMEVGLNISTSSSHCDIVFCATFRDGKSLADFDSHPYHKEVSKYVDTIKDRRHVVEYTLSEADD
jgi:hypothetical protein